MKGGLVSRIVWAVVGLLAMGAFFWAYEDFTRDNPPLWLQVAVSVGGVGAWLKVRGSGNEFGF
jgi:hypothetical protein